MRGGSKMRSRRVHNLSIEEIKALLKEFKDEMDRKQEQFLLRDENRDAYAAMMAKKYVDRFVDSLELAAGSRLQEYLARPARARPIRLSPRIINRK